MGQTNAPETKQRQWTRIGDEDKPIPTDILNEASRFTDCGVCSMLGESKSGDVAFMVTVNQVGDKILAVFMDQERDVSWYEAPADSEPDEPCARRVIR